jgi:hypothetical protein
MRLSRRVVAVVALAALPLVSGCDRGPIGNTNNHISTGPALPEVHPYTPSASPS